MTAPHLDTLAISSEAYDALQPSMSFQASTRPEAQEWQRSVRSVLIDLLGGPLSNMDDRCDLAPSVVETMEFDSYTRETVIFQSRPNVSVFGYFLTPKDLDGSSPSVLCLPGHGRGVDDIVGIRQNGQMRTRRGGYQRDFALQCVSRGYPVLAIEQMGFGHRRDEAARSRGASRSSCHAVSAAALLLGETTVGWRVWDAIRSLDYMTSRAEVDAGRVVVMGISGGGTTTFFSAAIDERFRAAVVSGYFCTFRDSIYDIPHCIDNYVPGILKYVEMYDIAGLIAPRSMFVEVGDRDPIFPAEATRLAVDRARESFRVLGAEDRLGLEVFQGRHQFYGVGAFEHLSRVL